MVASGRTVGGLRPRAEEDRRSVLKAIESLRSENEQLRAALTAGSRDMDTNEVLEKLRGIPFYDRNPQDGELVQEAANEIERLRVENARMRNALREVRLQAWDGLGRPGPD